MTRSRLAAVAVLAVTAAGCGRSSYPVTGQIVFADGTPVTDLAGGGVEFSLVGGKFSSTSTIGPDGRFELYTIKPGDGVPPGTYRVAIVPPMPSTADTEPGKKPPPPPPPNPIAAKYKSADTSGLEVVIDRAMIDIRLTVDPAVPPKR